ncbi:helix-turn-helix transcriptional regulator [Kitasatospora sp. RG8]|nr:helix-turn-helix transcriptional regulator [Kitasatospora sp. RG8]MBP0455079.1 helix-turn-helix transcriptional regulator [Kitasatospora sp. RG8]
MSQVFAEMQALLEYAVSQRQLQCAAENRSQLVPAADLGGAGRALRECLAAAKQLIGILLPSDPESIELIESAVRDCGGLADGVRLQVLCSREVAELKRFGEYKDACSAFDFRVTDAPVHGAVLVDGEVALMQSSPGDGAGTEATLVRSPAVVRTLNALFAGAWRRATPLVSERFRNGFAKEVLRCLSEGYTDEAAARELCVSTRTYRRHVADLMGALGANSRFQAGIIAAEFGLQPTGVVTRRVP